MNPILLALVLLVLYMTVFLSILISRVIKEKADRKAQEVLGRKKKDPVQEAERYYERMMNTQHHIRKSYRRATPKTNGGTKAKKINTDIEALLNELTQKRR